MKGSEAKLVSYMQGSDKRFIIPVYQRNYDWKIENCKQLFDDLVKVIQQNRSSHFFGSIVSVHNDGAFSEFLIIDGQQRLTTISLLLLAMCNLMKSGVIIPAQSNLSERIYKTYLIDEWQEDDTRIKLKPVKNDRHAFDCLFGEASCHIPESNLTINYEYFCQEIQRERITIDQLYTAIARLEIINITLNSEDNPQLIFESLNSTGVALSEGDKIRNFILMGQPVNKQNEYYEKYWNRIEVHTNYDVSGFVRDYLSVKQQEIPSMSRVYFTFKAYTEETDAEIEPLLEDLLRYAKRYETLLKGKTTDKALNACIERLNRLETTVTRPFFLEILRLRDEDLLSVQDVREIFLYAENYLFRRTICDLPTNMLNKIFLTLHREILRYEGTCDRYVDKFKYALLSKNDRARFPDDAEFAAAFAARPVYQMHGKHKVYILERLENYGTVEDKDIYRHIEDGTYSIEHIMPQHLTPAWINSLGADYEQIHETWLHRIANLTLTGYNSSYSNKTFAEKRDAEHGFKDSGLRLNAFIAEKNNWTLVELEERSQVLSSRALKIWAMPQTDYAPAERQMDSCTLGDDVDLSGRIIARFAYRNTEQPVDSWISMFSKVLSMLHADNRSVLKQKAYSQDPDDELTSYVNHDPKKLRGALQIDTDIFVERNTSTATKVILLRRFFKAFGVDPEDLTFYLRDSAAEDYSDEAGTRFELRRKYWTFALDFIHAAHENGGTFQNVNPTKFNWIGGFIGIGGISIACVANFDSARVDLYIGRPDKETNKKLFDGLYSRKKEIEAALGDVPLEWRRNDETKASVISYTLNNVGIDNETDWTRMAKFHAEWSRRFYDIFTPYFYEMINEG